MKKIFNLYFLTLLSLIPLCIEAATIPYTPKIHNYLVGDYKAGNQNWAVCQGANGRMYFGNNRGLLEYDGIRWTLLTLPNKSSVRSVYADKSNRIYVGSYEEFGYYEADEKNIQTYYSLKDRIVGEMTPNTEIWTIHEYQEKIYFQSFTSFFVYDGEKVTEYKEEQPPLSFFTIEDKLYIQFLNGGFAREENGQFRQLFSREEINNDEVVSVLPYDDKLLLTTVKNGLYFYSNGIVSKWDSQASNLIKGQLANRATLMSDSSYVVGSISNGLIAFDKTGSIRWHINRDNNLINNTVLGVFCDSNGDLWASLDNGIAHIQTNSPIHIYEPYRVQIGMIYDMIMTDNELLFATNQGIYGYSNERKIPTLVPHTEEQVWYIKEIDNQIIAGHNKATLFLKNGKITDSYTESGGGTDLKKCIINGKEILLQSSYSQLSIFTKNNSGKWVFSHNVKNFNNLIRSFEVDPSGTIWATHMHRGLYRINLDDTLHEIVNIEYISSLTDDSNGGIINVMNLRGRIVFSDGKQFYTYMDISNEIVPYNVLNNILPYRGDTYRIIPSQNEHYWLINNKEYVLIHFFDGRFEVIDRIPFSFFHNPTIENNGNIYIDNNGDSHFCLNGGIARYSSKNTSFNNKEYQLELVSVSVSGKQEKERIYLPVKTGDNVPVLEHFNNSISFELSYPDYSRQTLSVEYKLEGFEKEWKESPIPFSVSYSDLPYGSFVLSVEIKDGTGKKLSSLSYPFTIKEPFYKSVYAIVLYILLLIILIILFVRYYIQWEVNREKRRVAEQMNIQEQLIMKLENEKLENELTYKSKELASTTLAVISKNDFLEELKRDVQEQKLSGTYSKRFFDKLMKKIDGNITNKNEWAIYQANFDHIHERFFVKLKDRYPDLTSGDLRMCALLRLNMPTKDMASMLNLSIRGVEAARYRLRKKIGLEEGENLTDFILRFN